MPALQFGLDRLLTDPALRRPLRGRRLALLAHPAERPDFHHPDSLVLTLDRGSAW